MRRHASGTGRGARGRGMNAPPKLPGGAGLRPGTLGSPARSWLTAKPLDLPEARKLRPPKRGRGSERRQGETVGQKARPGAAKTPRWRAERRHTFARRCDKDCMTRHRKSGLPDLRNKHARSRVNPRWSARHPLIFSRGTKRDYGLPGAAKNTGDSACLGASRASPARAALATPPSCPTACSRRCRRLAGSSAA